MKAATVSVRIADFLKEYPPFSFLRKEDIAALAAEGRVKFHEDGEIVFTTGQPRDRFLYVVQQGRVRIIEESEQGDNLIDLRGPGDILGLQGIISDEPYQHTARTEAETILYGLPRDGFVRLAQSNPEARRYLAAYFSLNPAHSDDMETQRAAHPHATLLKGGLQQVDPVHITAHLALVTVPPDAPVREVAKMLTSKVIHCVLIVDDEGRPLGKITDADLRDRILDGRLRPDSLAGEVMFTDLVTGKRSDDTGKLIIRMTRAGKHFVIITEDGTLDTRAVGLVSERNLFLQYGRFPTVLGEAISFAANTTMLRVLRERLEAVVLEFLDDRASMKWLMALVGVLNRKMVQRIMELVEERMEAEGWSRPGLRYSWLMMGSGGRDELLIRSAVYHALVYDDPAAGEECAARKYFRELAARVGEGIRQCGFLESPQGVLAFNDPWCRPMSGMKKWFSDLIREPDLNNVYDARDAFDFRPVIHLCPLSAELRNHIHAEIDANPGFIRHMANDSLLNQPPRTIFQHYVVDEKGMQAEALQIKVHALLPLVDIARVFAMERRSITLTSTWRRLEEMATRMDAAGSAEDARVLREAAQAFILAAHVRTRAGLIGGTDGAVVRPSNLNSETRNLLKTAFRSILEALELTADRYGLDLRA